MIIPYTNETQHCVMDESARPYEDNEKKLSLQQTMKSFSKIFCMKRKTHR